MSRKERYPEGKEEAYWVPWDAKEERSMVNYRVKVSRRLVLPRRSKKWIKKVSEGKRKIQRRGLLLKSGTPETKMIPTQ